MSAPPQTDSGTKNRMWRRLKHALRSAQWIVAASSDGADTLRQTTSAWPHLRQRVWLPVQHARDSKKIAISTDAGTPSSHAIPYLMSPSSLLRFIESLLKRQEATDAPSGNASALIGYHRGGADTAFGRLGSWEAAPTRLSGNIGSAFSERRIQCTSRVREVGDQIRMAERP